MAHLGIDDKNRREIRLLDRRVEQVLPLDFQNKYPKLFSLFKQYYEFQSEYEVTELLEHLFETRDVTVVDESLLLFIEDELLLGQSYFEGFSDKRSAAKFSNTLYRSKGTQYSIQQFFRMFFGEDPDVIYPKENVFTLNDSKLGGDDFRFLTDDKLYQTFSILIRSGLSVSQWLEIYKLFVHPAGFYVAGEVLALGQAFLGTSIQEPLTAPPGLKEMPFAGLPDPIVPIVEGLADLSIGSILPRLEQYAIWDSEYTNGIGQIRLDASRASTKVFQAQTLQALDNSFPTLLKLVDGYVIGQPLSGFGIGYSNTAADSAHFPVFPSFDMDSDQSAESQLGTLMFDLDSSGDGAPGSDRSLSLFDRQ